MFGVCEQDFESGLKTQNANRTMSIDSFEQNRNYGTKVCAQSKCSQLITRKSLPDNWMPDHAVGETEVQYSKQLAVFCNSEYAMI